MKTQSCILWDRITHILYRNGNVMIHYFDKNVEYYEMGLLSFNSLLVHNENFIKVNYDVIVNRKFIDSIFKVRKKIVLLIDKYEIVVSRRKAYHFK